MTETETGYTALHVAASLGNSKKSAECVRRILECFKGSALERSSFLNAQDATGATALNLAASRGNAEACQVLQFAGSKFDIKSKAGDTPLERVFRYTPQAMRGQLEAAVKNSGYVDRPGCMNDYLELDFGPILGYSSSSKIYTETKDIAKVCYSDFDGQKEFLDHPFVRVFIYKKWEKVWPVFYTIRLFKILWFLLNAYLFWNVYRVKCPYSSQILPEAGNDPLNSTELTNASSWPISEAELNSSATSNCEIGSNLNTLAWLNLVIGIIYLLSQGCKILHCFTLLFRFRSVKTTLRNKACSVTAIWELLLGTGIIVTTVFILKILKPSALFQHGVATAAGFLSLVFILFEFGKIPKFRVYTKLLYKLTKTYLSVMTISIPILLGFAFVFGMLLLWESAFSSATGSFMKVVTLMVGELDYKESTYSEKQQKSPFFGPVLFVMLLFVVLVVQIYSNYLIGVAAQKIGDLYSRTEVWKLCTQLEQIVMLESFLNQISCHDIGRAILKKYFMLMPPHWNVKEKKHVQKRQVEIYIPNLPKAMQKELHELDFNTIRQVRR